MKRKTIGLAAALALSSTLAFAQAGTGSVPVVPEKSGAAISGGSGAAGTTTNGMTTGRTGTNTTGVSGGGNGTADGPTTLSGTGTSQSGGNTPGPAR